MNDEQMQRWMVAMHHVVETSMTMAQALVEAFSPVVRAVLDWHTEMSRARLIPRQYRNTIMQKKLRRLKRAH